MEDFPELHAAVKKGQGAVERSFKDMPGFDPEFRAAFRVKKVEFTGGRHSSIVIQGGEDPSSPDVTVPNPLWGMERLMEMFRFGKEQSFKEMVTRKRLRTNLQFMIRKLSGVVGVLVTRIDYQKLVGKKHVNKERKLSDLEFGGFFDEFGGVFDQLDYLFDESDHEFFDESDDELDEDDKPRSNLLADEIHSRGELASAALEIEDVVADEAQHMLTISFKRPLRAFAQKSRSKDREFTFEEVDARKKKAVTAAGSHEALGQELAGMVPWTMKMNLYFEGSWVDGEGKACLEELKAYLAELRNISQAVEKKRELVASFRKRQNERKGRKFSDLPGNSYARKAIKEFNLDITKTGCWDSSVLEEEWKAWYELRETAESKIQRDAEEDEGEEELSDLDYEDGECFESPRFRRKMLKTLRTDYAKALKDAGLSACKAKAAATGLYITSGEVVDAGDGAPRRCTLSIHIFSAVGNSARLVELEHEHHCQARAYTCEHYAYIKARVKAFDPETGKLEIADDLAGTADDFDLFSMDCDEKTDECSYSLASENQVQRLVAAIFGQKSSGSFLTRSAFRVFMMACGADAFPFTEMSYLEYSPLAYLDMKLGKKRKK